MSSCKIIKISSVKSLLGNIAGKENTEYNDLSDFEKIGYRAVIGSYMTRHGISKDSELTNEDFNNMVVEDQLSIKSIQDNSNNDNNDQYNNTLNTVLQAYRDLNLNPTSGINVPTNVLNNFIIAFKSHPTISWAIDSYKGDLNALSSDISKALSKIEDEASLYKNYTTEKLPVKIFKSLVSFFKNIFMPRKFNGYGELIAWAMSNKIPLNKLYLPTLSKIDNIKNVFSLKRGHMYISDGTFSAIWNNTGGTGKIDIIRLCREMFYPTDTISDFVVPNNITITLPIKDENGNIKNKEFTYNDMCNMIKNDIDNNVISNLSDFYAKYVGDKDFDSEDLNDNEIILLNAYERELTKDFGLPAGSLFNFYQKNGKCAVKFDNNIVDSFADIKNNSMDEKEKDTINKIAEEYNKMFDIKNDITSKINEALAIEKSSGRPMNAALKSKMISLSTKLDNANSVGSIIGAISDFFDISKSITDQLKEMTSDEKLSTILSMSLNASRQLSDEENKLLEDAMKKMDMLYITGISPILSSVSNLQSELSGNMSYIRSAIDSENSKDPNSDLYEMSLDYLGQIKGKFDSNLILFKSIRKNIVSKYVLSYINNDKLNLTESRKNEIMAGLDYVIDDPSSIERSLGIYSSYGNAYIQMINDLSQKANSNGINKGLKASSKLDKLSQNMRKTSNTSPSVFVDYSPTGTVKIDKNGRKVVSNYKSPTGYFRSPVNINKFQNDVEIVKHSIIKQMNDNIIKNGNKEPLIKSITTATDSQVREFTKLFRRWQYYGMDENCNIRNKDDKDAKPTCNVTIYKDENGNDITDKYFEAFDNYSDYNIAELHRISESEKNIYSKYRTSDLKNSEYSDEDREELELLKLQRRSLGSFYNPDGSFKTGEDLKNAYNYNDTSKKIMSLRKKEYDNDAFEEDFNSKRNEIINRILSDDSITDKKFAIESALDESNPESLINKEFLNDNRSIVGNTEFYDALGHLKTSKNDLTDEQLKYKEAVRFKRRELRKAIDASLTGTPSPSMLEGIAKLDHIYRTINKSDASMEEAKKIYESIPTESDFDITYKDSNGNEHTTRNPREAFVDSPANDRKNAPSNGVTFDDIARSVNTNRYNNIYNSLRERISDDLLQIKIFESKLKQVADEKSNSELKNKIDELKDDLLETQNKFGLLVSRSRVEGTDMIRETPLSIFQKPIPKYDVSYKNSEFKAEDGNTYNIKVANTDNNGNILLENGDKYSETEFSKKYVKKFGHNSFTDETGELNPFNLQRDDVASYASLQPSVLKNSDYLDNDFINNLFTNDEAGIAKREYYDELIRLNKELLLSRYGKISPGDQFKMPIFMGDLSTIGLRAYKTALTQENDLYEDDNGSTIDNSYGLGKKQTSSINNQFGFTAKMIPYWGRSSNFDKRYMNTNVNDIMTKFAKIVYSYENQFNLSSFINCVAGVQTDANSSLNSNDSRITDNTKRSRNNFSQSQAVKVYQDIIDLNLLRTRNTKNRIGSERSFAKMLRALNTWANIVWISSSAAASVTNLIQEMEVKWQDFFSTNNRTHILTSKRIIGRVSEPSYIADKCSNRIVPQSTTTTLLDRLNLINRTKYDFNSKDLLSSSLKTAGLFALELPKAGYAKLFDLPQNEVMMFTKIANFRFAPLKNGGYRICSYMEFMKLAKNGMLDIDGVDRKSNGSRLKKEFDKLDDVFSSYSKDENGVINENDKYKDAINDKNYGLDALAPRLHDILANMLSTTQGSERGKMFTDDIQSNMLSLRGWILSRYRAFFGGMYSGPTLDFKSGELQTGFFSYLLRSAGSLVGLCKSNKQIAESLLNRDNSDIAIKSMKSDVMNKTIAFFEQVALYGALLTLSSLFQAADPTPDDHDWFFKLFALLLPFKLFTELIWPLFPLIFFNSSINKIATGGTMLTSLSKEAIDLFSHITGNPNIKKSGPYKGMDAAYVDALNLLPYKEAYFGGDDRSQVIAYNNKDYIGVIKSVIQAYTGMDDKQFNDFKNINKYKNSIKENVGGVGGTPKTKSLNESMKRYEQYKKDNPIRSSIVEAIAKKVSGSNTPTSELDNNAINSKNPYLKTVNGKANPYYNPSQTISTATGNYIKKYKTLLSKSRLPDYAKYKIQYQLSVMEDNLKNSSYVGVSGSVKERTIMNEYKKAVSDAKSSNTYNKEIDDRANDVCKNIKSLSSNILNNYTSGVKLSESDKKKFEKISNEIK